MSAARLSGLGALLLAIGACQRGTPEFQASPGTQADAGSSVTYETPVDGGTAEAGATDGAAALDAADAGEDADVDAGSAPPYSPPPICSTSISIGPGVLQDVSTGAGDHGLSVTADELSIAWVTTENDVVTVHYADRSLATQPFGAVRTLTGDLADTRVALMPDGLGLAVVHADFLGFSLLRRDHRGDAFGAPEVGPFMVLDQQGETDMDPWGERYADPLFVNDADFFVFSRYGGWDPSSTVDVASHIFAGEPYSPGVPFLDDALAPTGTARMIVTGAAVDARTVFVWDEALGRTRAITIGPSGQIESSVFVGAIRDVQPNAACDHFWFTAGSPSKIYRSP